MYPRTAIYRMLHPIKKVLRPFLKHRRSPAMSGMAISTAAEPLQNFEVLESIAFEQGVALSRANSQLWCIRRLSDIGFSVFSQWDDDGIISWLVDVLPELPKAFVEFGVENYRQSNTRFLLRHRR